MPPTMNIAGRPVGPGHPPYIVAEMSGNHNGDIRRAFAILDAAKAAIGHVLPGFNLIIGPESDPRVVLDALRGVTEVKVLSSPSVVVMDNKPATLQVGEFAGSGGDVGQLGQVRQR